MSYRPKNCRRGLGCIYFAYGIFHTKIPTSGRRLYVVYWRVPDVCPTVLCCSGGTREFFKFKNFLYNLFWLLAAPQLKNNIKFKIYGLENIKFLTFKALISRRKMVESFEVSKSLCAASCLTSILATVFRLQPVFFIPCLRKIC